MPVVTIENYVQTQYNDNKIALTGYSLFPYVDRNTLLL